MGFMTTLESPCCTSRGSQGASLAWTSSMSSTTFAFQSPFEAAFSVKPQQGRSQLEQQQPLLPTQRSQSLGNEVPSSNTMLYRAEVTAPESPFSRLPAACNRPSVAKLACLQPLGMPKLLSASLSSPELKGMCKDTESPHLTAARATRAESAQPKRASLPNLSSGDAVVPTLAQEFSLSASPSAFASSSPFATAPSRSVPGSKLRVKTGGSPKSSKAGRSSKEGAKRKSQLEKIDDLQAVLHYNVALQTRAKRMEKTLLAKGNEIARLAAELAEAKRSFTASPTSCQPSGSGEGDDCCCPVTIKALHGREDGRLQRLLQLAQLHALHATAPDGSDLTTPVLEQLRCAVHAACTAAEEALCAADPCAALPVLEAACAAATPEQAAMWAGVVQAVKLSKQQAARVVAWRAELLARMHTKAQDDTSQLSELAAAGASAAHGSASGRSFLAWAKASVEAAAAMARMQARLKGQRCALARANTALLQEVLSPVQAALLMARAWPAHCDCLGFAAAVKDDQCATSNMEE